MKIRSYTFGEFVERVKSFHGFEAPGVIIGGFMVDLAYRHLPREGLFNALCETAKCLPDSLQLLTAFTLYDKETGEGVRVFIDPAKLEAWPEIKAWFLKLKTKEQQDFGRLIDEARRAGALICGIEHVRVPEGLREKKHRGQIAVCPRCKEAYPLADGTVCLACQGGGIYCHASGTA